jgi:Ca-activated chloride channel family protein
MQATVLLDRQPVRGGGTVVRLLLKLAGDAPPFGSRTPLNLSVVLDRSGSMHGDKIAAARDAAALLVRRLAPSDVVSVVAYDENVTVVAPPSLGADRRHLARDIGGIEVGGSTNLSGGWMRGRELVMERKREGAVNRVLLLTDGRANVGIIDRPTLTGLCRTAGTAGVTTTTIGFGQDYDEHLLRAMADAGGGSMYYIETPDQAAGIFADELKDLMSVAAQNVTVTVRPHDAVQLTAVHHEYPSAQTDAGMVLELGDLYAGEPKSLLADFFTGEVTAESAVIATLTVRAAVITANGVEMRTIDLPIHCTLDGMAHTEPEVESEAMVQEAARVRREALRDEAMGQLHEGRSKLRAMTEKLRASGIASAAMDEEIRDIQAMEHLFAAERVTEMDRKYMGQRAYNSATGRRSKTDLIRRTRKEEKPPRP